jgi:hypothetical protein
MSHAKCARVFVLVLGIAAGGVAVAGESTPLQPKMQNGITYLTGGIGQDQVQEMRADAREGYNLQLVFATQKSGEYVANVRVMISDAKGETLIDAVSDGPGFYAKLPAGHYKISAENRGKLQVVSIDVTGHNINRHVLYWSAEPGQDQGLQ